MLICVPTVCLELPQTFNFYLILWHWYPYMYKSFQKIERYVEQTNEQTNKRTKIFLSVTSIIIAELERQLRTTTLSLIQAAAVYSNAFHSWKNFATWYYYSLILSPKFSFKSLIKNNNSSLLFNFQPPVPFRLFSIQKFSSVFGKIEIARFNVLRFS